MTIFTNGVTDTIIGSLIVSGILYGLGVILKYLKPKTFNKLKVFIKNIFGIFKMKIANYIMRKHGIHDRFIFIKNGIIFNTYPNEEQLGLQHLGAINTKSHTYFNYSNIKILSFKKTLVTNVINSFSSLNFDDKSNLEMYITSIFIKKITIKDLM